MADLEDLRQTLEANLQGAFNSDEAIEFRQELEDNFPDSVATAFEDCAQGNGPGNSFQDCVQQVADDNDLSGTAADAFSSGVPEGVMNALMSVGAQWSADQREMVREIANSNDLDELNRDCAKGNYGDVSDALSLDGQPTNFQDCVTQVSEAQDIRGELKDLWGTA
jgi:hypothetical protein